MVFRMAGSDSWGAVDIAYSMGPFQLGPEEALLMEGRFPPCAFANVVLWNKQLAALEYRDRRVSLNRVQTKLEPDGSFRMVIAHRDPGVPNWLDTEGHRDGTVFWRFLLPEESPRSRAAGWCRRLVGAMSAAAPGASRRPSRACAATRFRPGTTTRSSGSSCTGRWRRCPPSRRASTTSSSCCAAATATSRPTRPTSSGTRTR
jgi:hypothetical protein